MESIGSSFFPAPQRTEVAHLPVEQAGGTGKTFRATDQENKSMIDTFSYFMEGWKKTPYEQQFAVGPKVSESKILSDSVSMTNQDWVGKGLDWALGAGDKLVTIVDNWNVATGQKPIAVNTAGSSKGGAAPSAKTTTTEFGTFVKRGAEVLETFKSAAGNILGQAKGLFNLGFEGDKSPVFSISHELDTGTKLAVGSTGIILLVIIAIFLFRGRK